MNELETRPNPDPTDRTNEGDFSVSISPNPYYIHKGFKK